MNPPKDIIGCNHHYQTYETGEIPGSICSYCGHDKDNKNCSCSTCKPRENSTIDPHAIKLAEEIDKVREFLIPRAYPDIYESFSFIAQALLDRDAKLKIAVGPMEIASQEPCKYLGTCDQPDCTGCRNWSALSHIRSLPTNP